MLHSGCVPRDLYDVKCVEYNALLEKYHALKLAGAVIPPEPKLGRVVGPPPDPEATAAKRMHDDIVESLARDIEAAEGVPKEIAKAEADRLRRVAFGQDGVP